MIKNIWEKLGNALFWMAWPALWVYLRIGKRTRIFIVCDNEFLVLKGWLGSGQWMLPGGGLHRGEDPEAGLIREVREETGLKLEKGKVKFAYEATQTHHGLRFSYNCYTLQLPQKPLIKTQRGEITDFAWQSIISPILPLTPDAQKAARWWQNKG